MHSARLDPPGNGCRGRTADPYRILVLLVTFGAAFPVRRKRVAIFQISSFRFRPYSFACRYRKAGDHFCATCFKPLCRAECVDFPRSKAFAKD